jgi:hypothetical protein
MKQEKDKKPYRPPTLKRYGEVSHLTTTGTPTPVEDMGEVNPQRKG